MLNVATGWRDRPAATATLFGSQPLAFSTAMPNGKRDGQVEKDSARHSVVDRLPRTVEGTGPNQHGVYTEPTETRCFEEGRLRARIRLAELVTGEWVAAMDFAHRKGSYRGHGEPLMPPPFWPSREAAIQAKAAKLRRLQQEIIERGTTGTVTEAQLEDARRLIKWAKGGALQRQLF